MPDLLQNIDVDNATTMIRVCVRPYKGSTTGSAANNLRTYLELPHFRNDCRLVKCLKNSNVIFREKFVARPADAPSPAASQDGKYPISA